MVSGWGRGRKPNFSYVTGVIYADHGRRGSVIASRNDEQMGVRVTKNGLLRDGTVGLMSLQWSSDGNRGDRHVSIHEVHV